MSDVTDVAGHEADNADAWRELNAFTLTRADGWMITRYMVMQSDTYLAWDPFGKAHGPVHDMASAKSMVPASDESQ